MRSIQLQKGFAFGKQLYQLHSFHGAHMRVAHDLLSSVAFLSTGSEGDLTHQATAFLMLHKGALYLVTAKHVAESLGDNPYFVRFNRQKGEALLPIDFAMGTEKLFCWFAHPEPSIDLAVLPFPIDIGAQGVVAVALNSEGAVKPGSPTSDAGCGDMCHVIGLFSAMAGKSRNIAVVHTGHIAAMADSKELIPADNAGHPVELEGYLVEISNLSGLSGAPVFVRGGVELDVPINENDTVVITALKPELKLLGVWAGSWDKPTSRINDRVPVGIGIVTPAYRLIELLDSPAVTENRKSWIRKSKSAKLD